jgi:sugar-specific transcriptional regulator TrmB
MNEQELISHIEELGLSNKEARVYVASLIVGPSAVQRIAEQSGIKRVTTYVILESLVGLGLVSQSIKGKKTYFIAEEPSNLHRLIERREQELSEQKINFDQILPELNGLKSTPKEAPNVKFYDSIDGIRTIMNEFPQKVKQSNTDFVYSFSNLDQFYGFFPEFESRGANPDRVRSGVPSRSIYTSTQGPILAGSDKANNRQSRWLPMDKYPVSGDFTVAGEFIIMMSLAGSAPMGITITSRDLAQGLQALFQIAWDAAEPYNK